MTQDEMTQVMESLFKDCQETRESGQKEYAHDPNNSFRNFEALSKELDIPREKVLWLFMKKHLDGVLAHINGHISQREPVRGRIKDIIVYLCLLEGMFQENLCPISKYNHDALKYNSDCQSNTPNILEGQTHIPRHPLNKLR